MNWTKASVAIKANGEKAITYVPLETNRIRIESRKSKIPHANGVGTWEHTFYYVIENGKDVKQCSTLKEAKAFAEALDLT